VETVKGIPGYVAQFDKIFEGKDGSAVTIENIGKAIASFERVLVTSPSPYDYNEKLRSYGEVDEKDLEKDDPDLFAEYTKAKALAETHKMSDSAKRGRDIFFGEKGGCTACHVGANLTDELYHNLGVGLEAGEPDHGLYAISKDEKHKGAFKTPTIRNVATSAPYMHDGSQKTLEDVVEWYAKGGYANAGLDPKIKKLDLSDQDKKDLVEFMKACSSDFPVVEKFRLPQ
jgi:cytochrome c peroxidase